MCVRQMCAVEIHLEAKSAMQIYEDIILVQDNVVYTNTLFRLVSFG